MGEPGRIVEVRRSSSLVVAAGELRSSSLAAVAGVRRSLSWAAERNCFSGVVRSWFVAAELGPSRCFLAVGRSWIDLGSVHRTGLTEPGKSWSFGSAEADTSCAVLVVQRRPLPPRESKQSQTVERGEED